MSVCASVDRNHGGRMPEHGKSLIVPVETQVREFDPKLLFSCVAAEQGFRAFLGSQTAIHLKISTLPRGIYVAKDIRKSKVRMMRIMNDLGHRVVAWDEEGLVRYPSNHYFKTRVASEALDRTDIFFAWGQEDAATLKAFPDYKGTPVYETGNPRIDLLRREFWPIYQEAAATVNQRYGRYILINTNFGHSNHFLASQTIRPEALSSGSDDQISTNWDRDLAHYRDSMFRHFQKMVPEIARAFPDIAVVLRPHPAESHEAWIRSAEGCRNVHVVHEGSVLPWIFGADVVVHNGCTTAVEAFLVERAAVTYRPIQSDRFDRHLPDAVSYQAFDMPQLIAEVGRFVGGHSSKPQTDAQRTALDRHLAPQNGKLASDQIIDILRTSDMCSEQSNAPSWTNYLNGWIEAHRRAIQKKINSLVPGSKNSRTYERHRFPDVSTSEVNNRIRQFADLLGRFHDVRASKVSDGIFRIET